MRNDLCAKVLSFINDHELIKSGDKVLAALSGGADSVALLHVLDSLKEELHITLCAAHFNHGIRGEEADRDQAFATALCEKYQIKLFCEKADVPAIADESGESLELCGRRLRYAFLERIAKEIEGAKIATAHHSDDNAETVLWNLTRGSGIGGLCGIPAKRENIIRPLLCCSRAEIEGYCDDHQLEYVTDSTNLSDEYTRNKLRHQVMPVLKELNPRVGESIAHTAALMRETDEYFNEISVKELKQAETDRGYDCERLLQLPLIVLRYAVKNLLGSTGAPVDFRHIALIIEAMRRSSAVELGQGFTAICSQGTLRIVRESEHDAQEVCIPFDEFIKTGGTRVKVKDGELELSESELKRLGNGENVHNLLLHHCIPCDIITCDTFFRYRRAGDIFTFARRGVTKSVKKLMIEMKLPREVRDTVPLIADGSNVLWLEGIGTSAQANKAITRNGEVYLIFGGSKNA